MIVYLLNDDPFGNNVRVVDRNAGDAEVYNGFLDAHAQVQIQCTANSAGYGNLTTYQENNAGINRSLLSEGEVITL